MVQHLNICDHLDIPIGNLCFVGDVSDSEQLHQRCVELEQLLKRDYIAFAHQYRMVLEEFALCEETKRRIIESEMRYNEEATRRYIIREIKNADAQYGDIVITLCCATDRRNNIEAFLRKQSSFPDRWTSRQFDEDIEAVVRKMFRFGSANSHAAMPAGNLTPSDEVCREFLRLLFDFFCAYYGEKRKYNGSAIPFGDYYPVPKNLCKEHGIDLPQGKQFLVRQENGKTLYYIFTDARGTIKDTQRRDIETLNSLWMDNAATPQNILGHARLLSNKNGIDYRYLEHQIPSFPHSLTDEYLSALDDKAKLQIVRGIAQGVSSMHTAEPPFYHRALSLSDFLVCQVRNGLKPILINFDCVKDMDEDAEYTVFYAVNEKIDAAEDPDLLFAPELLALDDDCGDDIDWAKVDIYALGRCILKILTNSYVLNEDTAALLTPEQYDVLTAMCSEDLSLRPNISEVQNVF